MKIKRKSFSKELTGSVYLSFGLSFSILFIGIGVLLFLNRDDISMFYIKLTGVFGAFLLMYIILVVFITKKLKKQFAPLDKLAQGLSDSELSLYGKTKDMKDFIQTLNQYMSKMDNISRELDRAKEDLDDLNQENDKTLDNIDKQLNNCKSIADRIMVYQNKVIAAGNDIDLKTEEINDKEEQIKKSQNAISENKDNLNVIFKLCSKVNDDAKFDFSKTKEAFDVMNDTLNGAVELLENLFSDITLIQTLAQQNNLYALNTTLEASRCGIYNLNVVNALDEIKSMSDKILSKSDQIALILIQAKNSIMLAKQQSTVCDEQTADQIKTFGMLGDRFKDVTNEIEGTLYYVDELSDGAREVSSKIYEFKKLNESQMNDIMAQNRLIEELGTNLSGINQDKM